MLKLTDFNELIALTDRDAILTKLQQFSEDDLRAAFCIVLMNWHTRTKDYEATIASLEKRIVSFEMKQSYS